MAKATREKPRVLKVGIFAEKVLVDVVELPDPRVAFCRLFNELAKGRDSAYPVSCATALAKSNRLSE